MVENVGFMHTGGRRILSIVAIAAIALHAILWGIAPLSADPALDPFSVICHSETQAAVDQTPEGPAPASTHACDHCNLCSATAPLATLDTALVNQSVPAQLLPVRIPATAAGLADNPNRARGPPRFA